MRPTAWPSQVTQAACAMHPSRFGCDSRRRTPDRDPDERQRRPRTSLERSSQHSPSAERRPRPPYLRRSGSYSVPFASATENRAGSGNSCQRCALVSSRIRPANDRETSRKWRERLEHRIRRSGTGFVNRRRQRNQPREHSQGGDTGSNPVGTTSRNAGSEEASPPLTGADTGLGNGHEPRSRGLASFNILISSRICPANERETSRMGPERERPGGARERADAAGRRRRNALQART